MRVLIILALSAVTLSGQAPLRPSPSRTPPRDAPRPTTAPQSEAATAAIRGRVVVDGSDVVVPLVKTRVALSIGGGTIDAMFTDASGRFEFGGLPAGRYTLTAEKTGYAPTRYGAKRQLDPPQPIDVAPGVVEEIEVRMPKGAAIMGRVVDDLGDPVVGAHVTASVLQIEESSPQLVSGSRFPAETDDLGEYRIGGLAAGRYLLSVTARDAGTFRTTGGARRIGMGRNFYPSGMRPRDAMPVDLRAGEERGGLDLPLQTFAAAALSVTLTEAGNGSSSSASGAAAVILRTARASVTFVAPDEVALQQGDTINFAGSGFNFAIDPGEWIVVNPTLIIR